jgi:hypothetical protein
MVVYAQEAITVAGQWAVRHATTSRVNIIIVTTISRQKIQE